MNARERYTSFKKTQPRTPPLARETVNARGLDFAIWRSPDVAGAPPLLCVNGGMLYSHALLWPALAPLAATRQVILYDQRGRGASAVPPAPRSTRIEFDAGDIPALRAALGVARWDILGHSWGGGISMLAAANDAAGTRRLVLVNAVGTTSDWISHLHIDALARLGGAEQTALALVDPRALTTDDPAVHADYSRAIYPAYFADQDFARGFAPPREGSASGAAVSARLRREGYDWRERIATIAATTLILHGQQDVLPARLADETAALIRNAEVDLIDGAGHMPFWEQPERFFTAVERFLARPNLGA